MTTAEAPVWNVRQDTEYSFIGALMHSKPDTVKIILRYVRNDDLLDMRLVTVLQIIRGLIGRGITPDPLIIVQELIRESGGSDHYNYRGFVHDLFVAPYFPGNVLPYLEAVLEQSFRQHWQVSSEAISVSASTDSMNDLFRRVNNTVTSGLEIKTRLESVRSLIASKHGAKNGQNQ